VQVQQPLAQVRQHHVGDPHVVVEQLVLARSGAPKDDTIEVADRQPPTVDLDRAEGVRAHIAAIPAAEQADHASGSRSGNAGPLRPKRRVRRRANRPLGPLVGGPAGAGAAGSRVLCAGAAYGG
jgi:hypothetical protein